MPDDTATDALRAAYRALAAFVATMDDATSWLPTACEGWAVRDLVHHCLGDAQRGLVALHTPADGPPDRDAVSYWRPEPGSPTHPAGAANGRRFTRVVASLFGDVGQLRDEAVATFDAVRRAVGEVAVEAPVRTQGIVLAAGDLTSTLAVEATVHHLDLVVPLPDAPAPDPAALRHTRRVLDALLGDPAPADWDPARHARLLTGRDRPTAEERHVLGAAADRLPVLR